MARDRLRALLTEDRRARLRRAGRWATRSYLVVFALGIVIGLQVAPVMTDLATTPVRGEVAVIPLEGSIGGSNAAATIARLRQAREDPDVKAVVLAVNSGGGGAAAGEEIYLAVRKTAEAKPVVVSVNAVGASAAYFASVPAETIFVKPSSLIGSVGTIFVAPAPIGPIDELVITGPNKVTGADLREWQHKVESVQNAFVNAVYEHRGDRLELTEAELAYAKLYTGPEAVENGVADRIGGLDDAIAHAASLAGLTGVEVTVLTYAGPVTFISRAAYVSSDAEEKVLESPSTFVAPPSETAVPTILLLPPSVVGAALEDRASVEPPEVMARNGTVRPA